MNMIDIQDKLKNLSEDQLIKEMQAPSGQAPQFLVLSEITRRKKMRDGFKAQEAKQGVPSVAEEVMAAAAVPQQGLPQMASAMAPKSSIEQNTGIAALPTQAPVQRMASGGLVQKMADGGRIVVRNGKRFVEREDGTLVPETRTMSMFDNLRQFPSEIAAIPAQLGAAARDFSGGFADQMNADLTIAGDEAMRRQMAEDVYGMRAGPDTSYQYPPVPTMDATGLDQIAAAFSRTGPMTGGKTPQQLAMEAAQPQLPPAPLSPFGPDFEYGGRGPAVDLDLTAPEVPSEPTALDLITQQAWESTAPSAALGGPNVIPQAQRIEPNVSAALPVAPPAPVETGDPMLQFQEQYPIGGDGPSPGIGERIFGLPALEKAGLVDKPAPGMDTGAPLTGAELPPGEEDEGLLPPDAPQDTPQTQDTGPSLTLSSTEGGGGTGGGQGGSGGGSGQGGYISELESALTRAERTKEQDKWLALAQAGLALMASDQPTLGGAIGEAGQVGIEAFRGARDTYEESRMSILEAIAAQRAAAAKAAGRGGKKPMSIDDYLRAVQGDLEGIMVTSEDPITGAKVLVPRQGFEETAGELSTYYDDLLRRKYGIGTFDATQ